jgi:hypothetical protein
VCFCVKNKNKKKEQLLLFLKALCMWLARADSLKRKRIQKHIGQCRVSIHVVFVK